MTITQVSVPIDTLVPISRFGHAGASREFAKAQNGTPVTVLRNNKPAYVIVNADDYRELRSAQIALENMQARHEALAGIGRTFDNVDDLMKDLDA